MLYLLESLQHLANAVTLMWDFTEPPVKPGSTTPNAQHSVSWSQSNSLLLCPCKNPLAQALIHWGSLAFKAQVWTSGLLFKRIFCAANLKERLCSGKLWRGFQRQSSTLCHPSVIGTINTSSLSSKFVFSLNCSPLPWAVSWGKEGLVRTSFSMRWYMLMRYWRF